MTGRHDLLYQEDTFISQSNWDEFGGKIAPIFSAFLFHKGINIRYILPPPLSSSSTLQLTCRIRGPTIFRFCAFLVFVLLSPYSYPVWYNPISQRRQAREQCQIHYHRTLHLYSTSHILIEDHLPPSTHERNHQDRNTRFSHVLINKSLQIGPQYLHTSSVHGPDRYETGIVDMRGSICIWYMKGRTWVFGNDGCVLFLASVRCRSLRITLPTPRKRR